MPAIDVKEAVALAVSDGTAFAIILAGIVLLFLFQYFIRSRCPNCKRQGEMETTGEGRKGGWFGLQWQAEWRCKSCGHCEWRSNEEPPDV